uniref:Uncharacterized protein n=1 Tax=Avena sativa TaxID=4498 RepID=A0ACD5TSB2_AVESA
MDKTVTKTVVKAEPQQHHHGSTSAAAELIAVGGDPESLICPKCLHRLKPPVFQCAAGHLLCTTCRDELPEKNECASCFFTTATGYTRCYGVERILQSIRVVSHNAIRGMLVCNEKEEHGKMSPSQAGNEQRQGPPVKLGPCGGDGGGSWKVDVRGISRIVKVRVRHAAAVDAIAVMYERDGRKEWTKRWGGSGGKRSEICLQPEEYITCVKGHIGYYNDWFVVRSLTFVTNLRTFGRYGEAEGAPFQLPAAGGRIVGFHGRSGNLLDALGTYVRMDV